LSAVHSAAPRGAVLNLLRRLHFYIGLFVAPFIFVAALSGTLYVLTPQLENLIYADALTAQPQGNAQPLSAQIAAARAYAGENQHIYAVRPAPAARDTTRVQFSDATLGPSQSRAVFIDPYSLKVTGDMTVYGTSGVLPLRTTLDLLHSSLLLGDFGRELQRTGGELAVGGRARRRAAVAGHATKTPAENRAKGVCLHPALAHHAGADAASRAAVLLRYRPHLVTMGR
jgi:Uncharacterized iron-regulated membrane protein